MNNNEIKKIQNFKKNINVKAKERKKGRVYIDSCFVCPAGYNPKFKTTAENWISKFRNIKVNSRQLNPNQMNLLVINLYNKDMSFISKNHFEPLFISHLGESFYSGNIWQAFYGKTKDHILEEYCGCGEIPKMIFDGMFYTKASEAVSAAIIMMPSITVIYENPNAKTPLEYNVLMKLTKLYRFDLHLSQIRIPMSYYKNIDFKDEIEQQRRKINSISSFDCEFY